MFRTYNSKFMTFLSIGVTAFFLGYQLLFPLAVEAAPVSQLLSGPTLKLLGPLSEKVCNQATFSWETNVVLAPNQAFELIFWEDNQDPMTDGFSPIDAGPEKIRSVDLDMAVKTLNGRLNSARFYRWGVLLVETPPDYRRLQYLGGGHRFYLDLNGNAPPDCGASDDNDQPQQASDEKPPHSHHKDGGQVQQTNNQTPGSSNNDGQVQQTNNQTPGSSNSGGGQPQPSDHPIQPPPGPPMNPNEQFGPIHCLCDHKLPHLNWPNLPKP